MLKIIIFGLVLASVALSGTVSVASAETVPSPLQQFNQGVSLGQIQCNDSKILLLSPTVKPACVNEHSVEKLKDRGFRLIVTVEPVKTNEDEQRPPLHRGPSDRPILNRDYGGSAHEITQTLDDLQDAKQLRRESSARSSDNGFNVTDWVPDYIPKGYKLGYAVNSSHVYNSGETVYGLSMQFVPDSFIYTNSTIRPDVKEAGGIFYFVRSHNQKSIYLSYENQYAALSNLSIGYSDFVKSELIVNQTNGYFGIKKPDNEYAGFNARIAFDEYYIDISYYTGLPYGEGAKIINSIQGQVLPDE